ncbi:MAG: hypothetical protein SFZ24_10080 [Planctomycetota bacterium]|nr:hypothetical protein [Planctomycetota bacterium]
MPTRSSSTRKRRPTSGKSTRGSAAAPPVKRTVDLGRDEELVTWDEWFNRSMAIMRQAVPEKHHDRLAFRISLGDGRTFNVKQVVTHVSRGRCTITSSRWNEREAICDVITGYMLLGADEEGIPAALCVSPSTITSVECLLVPPDDDDPSTHTPFGFYKREGIDVSTQRKEVEEPLALGPI